MDRLEEIGFLDRHGREHVHLSTHLAVEQLSAKCAITPVDSIQPSLGSDRD
jgi:hypothetical protein